MEKNIFYLYPEVEGMQEFVCWGIEKKENVSGKEDIKKAILEALKEVSVIQNRWVSERSFSVCLGEDHKNHWIAIPRQLSVQVMKIFNKRFNALNVKTQIVITSLENPFNNGFPFAPEFSYDRGFIVDSTKIDQKIKKASSEKVVNI